MQEAVHAIDPLAEGGEGGVPGLGAGADEPVDGGLPAGRRLAGFQVQGFGQVGPGPEVELARFEAHQAEGQGQVVALGQGLLADLAGGPELHPVVGRELARRRAGQQLVQHPLLVVCRLPLGEGIGAQTVQTEDADVVQLGLLELDQFDQGADLAGAQHQAQFLAVAGHGQLRGGASGIDGQHGGQGVRLVQGFGVGDQHGGHVAGGQEHGHQPGVDDLLFEKGAQQAADGPQHIVLSIYHSFNHSSLSSGLCFAWRNRNHAPCSRQHSLNRPHTLQGVGSLGL